MTARFVSARLELIGPRPRRALISAALAVALGCRATVLTTTAPAPAPAPPTSIDPLDRPAPLDPAVRTGRLPNGLTFYVVKHGAPEQRAALWLAVDAGSAVENDDQRGLAHFVEHMAFDGTRRFPKHEIGAFIEKAGMMLGPDLNAYTGLDQTVYQLTVPSESPAVLAKGLDVLRDIAGDVTFDATEVDRERRIVHEEWRLKQAAATRVADHETTALLSGSRYAGRHPIGLPLVIEHATSEALLRFYRAWYRPETMAVIAVGDFDPAGMEAEIRARFGDFTNATSAPPRPSLAVPHAPTRSIAVTQDSEARSTTVSVGNCSDRHFEVTERDYRTTLLERLTETMESSRLAELRDEPSSPFVKSSAGRRNLTRTAVAYRRWVTVKEGRLPEALALLFQEIGQAARYGFLPSELERARNVVLARGERVMAEYDKASLRDRANEIVRNFTEHEEMTGPELELDWLRLLLPTITLGEVNALARAHASQVGQVIAIGAPANFKPPTVAEVRTIAEVAASGPLSPWIDAVPNEPLLATLPTPGRVIQTAVDGAAGATVWTLDNGVRVVVKPTAFRNQSVSLYGWQPGGTSLVSDADFPSARLAGEIVMSSGAGTLSQRTLNKLLAGKSVSVGLGLAELGAVVTAEGRPETLETMLQLLYLRLTRPRTDERAFSIWKAQRLEGVRHDADSPEQRFRDEISALVSSDNLRRRAVTADLIQAVDLGKVHEIWTRAFRDFGGFTFVFVGNIDLVRLRLLVETYLGSLPGTPAGPHWKDIGVVFPTGKVEKTIPGGRAPKSLVLVSFGAPARYTLDAERDARVLEALLRIRLREVLREGMGAVYEVSVIARLIREPTSRQMLIVSFGCAPENVDRLRGAVFDTLGDVARSGASVDLLGKVAEQLRRQHEVDLQSNAWWLDRLSEAYHFGEGFAEQNDVGALLARVTSASVQATARRMFDEKSYVLAILRPEHPLPAAPPAADAPETAAP